MDGKHEQWLATVPVLLGLGALYVGWANAAALVPPFHGCQLVPRGGVHLGQNLALVYAGCSPYEGAYAAFLLLTAIGLANVGGGYYIDRRIRSSRTSQGDSGLQQ